MVTVEGLAGSSLGPVHRSVVDEGASELFPHIYGPVRPAWVTDVRPARWEDDTFTW